MKFYNVQQGSEDWYRLRVGKPTASMFHKIITPKGEPSKQSIDYLYRLLAERMLNETMDDEIGFVKWVAQGKEREPQAVALYEFMSERKLEPGGFITTDDGRIGASPDRVSRDMKEGYEIKCPAPWTLLKYHLDSLGDEYRAQVQGHLLVGDQFQAVHFWAYHPQMPPFHRITLPDKNFQSALRGALNAFCDALDIMTERARSLGAYAVTRRAVTPAELAYGETAIKVVVPGDGNEDAGV